MIELAELVRPANHGASMGAFRAMLDGPHSSSRASGPGSICRAPCSRRRTDPAYRGVGRQFKTADGRAALAIYSQRNSQRDTPASYLRKNFLFPRATVSYERVTRDFFAVSGTREGMIFYSRCNVSPTGGTLHCFDLQFPARERTAWTPSSPA